MFAWSRHELNPEQEAAVLFAGSQLLIACPGSGKTRTLTYKIAYELSRLTSARQFVIAITYTNRAADEIRERIENLGVNTERLWIGTIHAFCLEWILKPYGLYHPDLAHGFRIIDLHEREKLLEQLCDPYRAQYVTFWDCDYYFTPRERVLGCSDTRKHAFIGNVLDELFATLKDKRQIDFELILFYAQRLVAAHPAISRNLSNLFSFVLVDEYQDTKEIQYAILGKIMSAGGGTTKLLMVGDPNQSIFGSLGGFPIDLNGLRAITGLEIESRTLSRNYRSSQRLIDYFENFNLYGMQIQASGPDRDFASLITYDATIHKDDLADEIAHLIQHNIEVLGVPPNEICVIAPQWPYLTAMTRALVVRLPEYRFDGPGIVPFARDTENFWYKVARLALTEPSPGGYLRRLRWAGDVIEDLSSAGVDVSAFNRKQFLAECNAVVIDETNGLRYLRRFFDTLFHRLQVPYIDFASLLEHHEAFFASSEARLQRLQTDGVAAASDVSFFKKAFQARSGILVSTIHGVKGAEFDVVIAHTLLQGMVPHFNDAGGDDSAKKLLYVIGSRARRHLHMFSETGRARGRRGDTWEATRLLKACVFPYDSQ
ncbi:UvrD-helicase domain-containing protein [Stutzerimonas stutzeri]|uniref:UvrD-helicase domain-containing protein n=1 Tax=Stutzerimonas stutzeri TaxID=316 RepID=UPI000650C0C9|nr:ATP-dependent helicase [Stutzerimonas stutzeri]AKN26924.1 UvrD/REP helicase [Stutzerimonas stutzeri]